MYCPSCGRQIADEAKHCTHCGKATTTAAPPVGDELDGLQTILTPQGQSADTASELHSGAAFDRRYVIDRLLGRGGMGVVYRATDNVTGDPVCLKLVHPELVRSEAHVQRFLREGKITRGLRHKNIVSVFDVNRADGQLYLSMECIDGVSLRHWLTRNLRERRTVPLSVAMELAREIGEGLAAAHGDGVVHRDLKPENVMLLADPLEANPGTPCRVKILDFGIARALAATEQLTVAGGAMGTPVYMAPEQETSADLVGPEADVYSLGAVFYEILLGVPPRGRFELPSKIRPELPKGIDELVEKALSPHPSRRPSNAREFVTALDRAASAPKPEPNSGDWRLRLDELQRHGARGLFSSGRWAWPKSYAQWLVVNAVPCFAWSAWLTVWLRTRVGKHLGYAALYSIPMFCAVALGDAIDTASGGYSFDAWGNAIATYGPSMDDDAALGCVTLILGFWIGAIVHARNSRALVDALIDPGR